MRPQRLWPVAVTSMLAVVLASPTPGQTTQKYKYDVLGRLIEVERVGAGKIFYTYDAAGNRTSQSSDTGVTTASANFGPDQGYLNQVRNPRFLGDVDGDGREDMIGAADDKVYVALAQPDGTFGAPIAASASFTYNATWNSADVYPRMAGDVDGDQKADLVGFAGSAVYVAPGQTGGTFGALIKAIDGYGAAVSDWASQDTTPRLLGDVTGDGKADVVAIGKAAVFVLAGQGDKTFAAPIQATVQFTYNGTWTSQNRYPRMLAKVDGDNCADLVGFAGVAVYVALSNCDGTFKPAIKGVDGYGDAVGAWSNFETYLRFVKDVNGDGKADVIGFGGSAVFISLGVGDGTFGPAVTYGSPFTAAWGPQSTRPRMVGNTDLDSRADFFAVGDTGVKRQQSPF